LSRPGAADRGRRLAFDDRATAYALWPELARGATRDRVLERLDPIADQVLLDLASGPGAMARAAGPFVARVVLCDLSPAMLRVAAVEARRAGRLVPPRAAADAAALPFRDGSFDLVACRHAARLFDSPERAVAEAHRVLRRGGRVAIGDVMATGEPEVDALLEAIESRLAPAPVKLLTPAAWAERLVAARFRHEADEQPLADLDAGRSLQEASARCGVSQAGFEELRERLLAAPEAARRSLGVLAHGRDVVYHPPFGLVSATRVT
jgi:ubiquinone/menaquinone biosynthesis C-methylase UbiE